MRTDTFPSAIHLAPSRRRRWLATAAPAAAALLGVAVLAVGGGLIDPSFAAPVDPPSPAVHAVLYSQLQADAMKAFRDHRFAAAYGRFATLADAGHAPSAHVALVMLRHGRAMFGSDWYASSGQQARWNAIVVNAGRDRIEILDDDGSSE